MQQGKPSEAEEDCFISSGCCSCETSVKRLKITQNKWHKEQITCVCLKFNVVKKTIIKHVMMYNLKWLKIEDRHKLLKK